MTIPERYTTPAAFRRAVEDRLRALAEAEQVDLQRFRRQLAFDRFLCRLFASHPDAWVLKGGYAMELRFAMARTTKDVDLTFRTQPGQQYSQSSLLDYLQNAAGLNLADGFSFTVGEATADLDGAPYGGARHPVEARMDGRKFANFHIDAGMGDVVLEPVEILMPRNWLGFAEVEMLPFRVLPAEQQFAEKYHAYTLPRGDRNNSRVRDLVDMVLLIQHGQLDPDRLRVALRATFDRRATHALPAAVPEPPISWGPQFATLAEACGLRLTMADGLQMLRSVNPSG